MTAIFTAKGRCLMGHLSEKQYALASVAGFWPGDVLSRFDVVAALSAGLAPAWEVERAIDPSGELSVVVLPMGDDPAFPSFVLYEKDGLVEVATIAGETWQSTAQFPTCQSAVVGIVAASALVCPC
jgi:hypothetical protein